MAAAAKPDADSLAKLDQVFASFEASRASQGADFGEQLRTFREAQGVNVAAFKACRRLMRMDPAKRSAWLDDFLTYVELLGLDRQLSLFKRAEASAPSLRIINSNS